MPALPPPSGMFWNDEPAGLALVAAEIVSPGPCTASLKGIEPIRSPASKLAPRSVEVNFQTPASIGPLQGIAVLGDPHRRAAHGHERPRERRVGRP